MKKFLLYLFPVVLYMAIIFIASTTAPPVIETFDIWQADKVLHLSAYFFLGFLWERALYAFLQVQIKKGYTRMILSGFFISFLYGFFIEICQYFIATRDFSIFDMAANGIGGFLGSYMYYRFLIVKYL